MTAFRTQPARPLLLLSACVFASGLTQPNPTLGQGDDETLARGRTIYRSKCASCHGENGQGVESEYSDPLVGDASVGELSGVIAETMPEDDPDSCVADDAAAVAAWIHHSFYSPAARLRNRPPRAALARLTGPQLRQSLADLYARVEGIAPTGSDSGLKGLYFTGARYKQSNMKIDRIDPVVDFDFGHEGPGSEISPEDFFIQWTGGLKVDVTGRYEIIVHSTCAFVLYFGTHDKKLINNHVQSQGRTEFQQRLTLTGGRVYPLRIDFFQRKRKTEQPPARITLSWKPPHGTAQPIPARNLVPQRGPASFSLQLNLPPDDRSYGYERGIAVDRQWDESTTTAALEFAQAAANELWPRYRRRHRKDSNENRAILRGFVAELVQTAFRTPLDPQLRKLYVDDQIDAAEDDAEAIRRALLISLKSPRFLYPMLDAERPASQRAANRLALTLFDSLPSDDWLRRAASGNKLETETQIRNAARRMVTDYRARAKTRTLLYEWLNLGQINEITKDDQLWAEFDAQLVAEMRASLDAFLDDIVWSDSSDFRQFFLADWTYTTTGLQDFYGEAWKPAADSGPALRRSVADSQNRFGILTHPYLMSGLAYHNSSSPIHRGVFLIRYMLGRTLRPPQEAFTPLSPEEHRDLTTRQRVELQTRPATCQTCHSRINALGFTLENFDAVGRYRTDENGKPLDTTGRYVTKNAEEENLTGPRDLAAFLANGQDAHRAFVARAFRHFVKQPIAAYGADTAERLAHSFEESGYNIRELLVEIAVVAASHREPAERETDNAESDDTT